MAKNYEGLKEADPVEIFHPDTGQAYGVSFKAFQDLYEPAGFEVRRMGDGQLLPSDPARPDPETLPKDNPPVMVGEPQPAPAEDGRIRVADLSDTERQMLKADGVKTKTIDPPAEQTPPIVPPEV